MLQSLYIAGAEPGSGKSVVVLGMMEALSAVNRRVGFFRPVIRRTHGQDDLIGLIDSRYDLPVKGEMLYGCAEETARALVAEGRYDDLLKLIIGKYKMVEQHCDLVLCAGTDFTGVTSHLEFDFNADVANNLGSLMVPVVKGYGRSVEETIDSVRVVQESLEDRGCEILAVMINRVPGEDLHAIQTRARQVLPRSEMVFTLPEHPSLEKPTIGEIGRALGAECLCGDGAPLNQVVAHYKVAAMQVHDFLDHVEDASLIITPGDRSDIILASLLADASTAYPRIAGLLLTGGQDPAPQIQRLLEGQIKTRVAILKVKTDTFTTALSASRVEATMLPGDDRKIAAALGLFETQVDLDELRMRVKVRRSQRVTPLMFEFELIRRAKSQRRHIVLPEGGEERILRAAEILSLRDVADLTLLGDPNKVGQRIKQLGLKLEHIEVIDPLHSPCLEEYAHVYYELRRHKGISEQIAHDTLVDLSYFGTMMVHLGHAHGMVSGAVHTTQHTIRPAFEIIRTRPDALIVSSVFFMCLEDRVLVYGDCAVNSNPDAEQLADIAISSARTAQAFGIEPRIAMLSYSTGESGKGADVDRVREAVRIARTKRPDLKLEGPIQYDAAVDASVARSKMPGSEVAGHATVFIFPDLNTGNNTYKAVQRSAGAVAIGPVLQGLRKPVNDLSRGCTVTDIVNTVAITAIQAQAAESAEGEGPP
jgi:phosphate acetyltransferase